MCVCVRTCVNVSVHICLHTVIHARTDDFWMPYADSLPQQHTLPLFFSREEVAALEYPHAIKQINMRARFLIDFYSREVAKVLNSLSFVHMEESCAQAVDKHAYPHKNMRFAVVTFSSPYTRH